jgi:hypothetical protein
MEIFELAGFEQILGQPSCPEQAGADNSAA